MTQFEELEQKLKVVPNTTVFTFRLINFTMNHTLSRVDDVYYSTLSGKEHHIDGNIQDVLDVIHYTNCSVYRNYETFYHWLYVGKEDWEKYLLWREMKDIMSFGEFLRKMQ